MKNYIKEIVPKYIGQAKLGPKVREAKDCLDFLNTCIKNDSQEHFIVLYLNGAHEIITYSVVTIGLLNSCQIHPREVFRPAILCASCSIILAHNHPSGNLEPSEEDKRVTKLLKDAGQVVGIKVLDHIIFTDKNYFSFQEGGIL